MKKREFKFYPEDFKQLPVKVIHMDLNFDVFDSYTKVKSDLKLKSLNNLNSLELNAKNLELLSIKCNFCDIDHKYKSYEDKIFIKFKKLIKKNTEFTITTETICKPTNNVLEGLYYDETPKNYPPTQITQCQQWGFQRLVPCIDYMNAKCTYITTITADSRYTNIITNGDVTQPRRSIGYGRDKIVYSNTKTPMAPYLFFLGVGTYSTFKREFEYPDGIKFNLEILAPLNSDKEQANKALDILFNGIMWIHLFTGSEKYNNVEIKNKIYSLINKREELKESNKDLTQIRNEIKQLAKNLKLGYKYTGTVYREIGMQNSNFGGMENVGNTTITANRLLPVKEMTDPAFEYMINVKVHEFYHNLNGSEVTGQSPFEIWLNEAVTVHIETEYLSEMMGEDYERLERVLTLISPGGTFDKDSSSLSMPIEPDGFNNPDELITDVTYIKAPEFIRMIQQLMGKKLFVKGLDLYHRTYKHSNATRKQWVEAMEKASKMKFQDMANTWLKQTNFPILDVKTKYSKNKLIINLSQKKFRGKKPWEFPLDIALIDKDGNIIYSVIKRIKNYKDKIIFDNVPKPEFVSLNRGYSFYGQVNYKQSLEELYNQVNLDSDLINKYIAFYKISEIEKLKLLKNKNAKVSNEFIDLFFKILSNKSITDKVGSFILSIMPFVEDLNFQHKYQDLYEVKEKILKSIALKYKKELMDIYYEYKARAIQAPYVQKEIFNIKSRQIKNLCLSLLTRLDTNDIHELIRGQYYYSDSFTDRGVAFSLYLRTTAKDKLDLLEEEEKLAVNNLVHYEAFLGIIGSNESNDALEIVKKIEKSPYFKIEQTNCQRSLYARFISNRRKSLLTDEGLKFTKEVLIKLSKINEYVTVQIINQVFGKIDLLEKEIQVKIIKIILEILKEVDKEKSPSAYNTITRLLSNSKKAVKSYELKSMEKIKF